MKETKEFFVFKNFGIVTQKKFDKKLVWHLENQSRIFKEIQS